MGQGAVILSGIFELSSAAPVKGIEVSRGILTLETKGGPLVPGSTLEIRCMSRIVQCLPMETAEMEWGAFI